MIALPRFDNPPLVLHLQPAIELDERQFFAFCRQNPELRIERSADGEVELMALAGGGGSRRNATVISLLMAWALRDGTGVVFDSSGGFVLPNGAIRAPDAAWVPKSRLRSLTTEQQERFLPLCPDFVIELRSPADSLAVTQEKMREYIGNGARLGWLIDVPNRQVAVYRPARAVIRLDAPLSLDGEPELPGFRLDLRPVWDLDF